MKQSVAVQSIWAGCEVYECSFKPTSMVEKASQKKIFSFVPPTSGMFIWVRETNFYVCQWLTRAAA